MVLLGRSVSKSLASRSLNRKRRESYKTVCLSLLGIQQRLLYAFQFRYAQLFPDLFPDLRDLDNLDLSWILLGLVYIRKGSASQLSRSVEECHLRALGISADKHVEIVYGRWKTGYATPRSSDALARRLQ